MKIIKFFGVMFIGALICFAGGYSGYRLYKPDDESSAAQTQAKDESAAVESAEVSTEKISDSTKIVYEYYYDGDGYVERVEDKAPYFLIGLNRNEAVEKMEDWQILKFSPAEVVIRKDISGNGMHNYIISEYEGLIAVFYAQPIDGEKIMEITNTPVNSLPEEEQVKIKNGIKIKGENELIKCMENYES